MIPEAVQRSPGIYLTAKATPKTLARRTSIMAVRPVIASNEGTFCPNEIGRIAQHAREAEKRKEGKDGFNKKYCGRFSVVWYNLDH